MMSQAPTAAPKSNPKFVSILDGDTVELFNRDTMYPEFGSQSPMSEADSWLGFLHDKRVYGYRRRLRRILACLLVTFTTLSLLFFISAYRTRQEAMGDYEYDDFDYISQLEHRTFGEFVRHQEQCHLVPPEARVDCNPDPPINRARCVERGCCWAPSNADRNHTSYRSAGNSKVLPPINVPYCYYGADYVGYKVKNESAHTRGHTVVELSRVRPSGFDGDVSLVRLEIFELDSTMVRIKLTDARSKRYEVPFPSLNLSTPVGATGEKLYNIKLVDNLLKITRRNSGRVVFEVNLAQLVFADQMLQLTTKLPSDFLYGIGEQREPFRKAATWKRYTLFNRDQYPLPDMALYGSHPFHLSIEEALKEKDNQASGLFLFNSNAMDIITQPAPAITYRTIGGVFDFFLFMGPKPEQVLQQYHQLIGLPQLPPYWALGFHLSRYGYRNMSNLQAVFERNRNESLPYDVQWTDIDVMSADNDFTLDKKNFQNLPAFIDQVLHPLGMRFVPMFDCAISAGEPPNSYPPFAEGESMSVFVRNHDDQVFKGKVWNRVSSVWPDFTHQNATAYWTNQFLSYHKEVAYDGAWIDMNEPSNFWDGEARGCPVSDRLEEPPYVPGMVNENLTLRHKTLCMTAKQSLGRHYDLHNLYGLTEAIVTNSALKKVLERRPFIISRSTAPGHGHYASHWTGDIVSDWSSMKWSVSSILNFNLFGIPMVGADICGFNGNTTEELCARWHQLGAFYTFARNHNTDDAHDQDPAALGATVVTAARNALLIRYAHLPYLYTEFYRVHRHGGAVLKPLFFEFPAESEAYKVDTQFLWGSSLLVAPALDPNRTTTSVYFPKGNWYFVGDYSPIKSRGEFIPQQASLDMPNVYYRAGSVLATQKPKTTTDATRAGNFILVVVLQQDEESDASGELYWDSGDGLDTQKSSQYNLYQFEAKNRVLEIRSQFLGYPTKQTVEEVVVLGVCKRPSSVLVDGKYYGQTSFDPKTCRLRVSALSLPLYVSDKRSLLHRIEWKK